MIRAVKSESLRAQENTIQQPARSNSHFPPAMENNAVSEAALRASIIERLNAVHVEITDMSGSSSKALSLSTSLTCTDPDIITGGCGQAFSTLIVSPDFAGKNSLKRHRLGR